MSNFIRQDSTNINQVINSRVNLKGREFKERDAVDILQDTVNIQGSTVEEGYARYGGHGGFHGSNGPDNHGGHGGFHGSNGPDNHGGPGGFHGSNGPDNHGGPGGFHGSNGPDNHGGPCLPPPQNSESVYQQATTYLSLTGNMPNYAIGSALTDGLYKIKNDPAATSAEKTLANLALSAGSCMSDSGSTGLKRSIMEDLTLPLVGSIGQIVAQSCCKAMNVGGSSNDKLQFITQGLYLIKDSPGSTQSEKMMAETAINMGFSVSDKGALELRYRALENMLIR